MYMIKICDVPSQFVFQRMFVKNQIADLIEEETKLVRHDKQLKRYTSDEAVQAFFTRASSSHDEQHASASFETLSNAEVVTTSGQAEENLVKGSENDSIGHRKLQRLSFEEAINRFLSE